MGAVATSLTFETNVLLRLCWVLLSLTFHQIHADVYLNNPRGSNNKLSEQSNNVQNDNRLFDSQNNGKAGYQIGDNCKPVCQNRNGNYDASAEGAMKGVMTYYLGSELFIEWHLQHGCGVGHPNLGCQIILQYMCEADNNNIRDGTKRGNQNTAGGNKEPPEAADADKPELGQHEPLEYYLSCKERERNKGLYTADQQVQNNRGATATRQNPNGNANANQRHGLECPEERDYYPYWHPTPWHDIAIYTSEPQERCAYYQAESQNVKGKGRCSKPEFNNPGSCQAGAGIWTEQPPFGEPAPMCRGGIQSRDNHNGNVRMGQPMYHLWRIPKTARDRCVLRLRYNISTADFGTKSVANKASPSPTKVVDKDPFFLDFRHNDPNPGQRRRSPFSLRSGAPVLGQDPQADFLNLGSATRVLQLQVNTNQLGRTFEDRTHTFLVKDRPGHIPEDARIVNYNVRGRRGNIVQVYPSVEYDFVPPDLTIKEGTFLHFQWTGSDANARGNAGNGRKGTDRSNLVQVAALDETVPLPIEQHSLFFDAKNDPNNAAGRALVDRFAYLNQDASVECDKEENNQDATTNCKQLNGASAYFDGGLVQMLQVGTHHIASTRNNDFSNRSHKAKITITRQLWAWYSILILVTCILLFLSLMAYLGAAFYAFKHPSSWLFSKRYRPRILNYLLKKEVLQKKEEQRRSEKRTRLEEWRKSLLSDVDERHSPVPPSIEAPISKLGKPEPEATDDSACDDHEQVARTDRECSKKQHAMTKDEMEMMKPSSQGPWPDRCTKWLRRCGINEHSMSMVVFILVNIVTFFIGFISNINGGFHKSVFFPLAKGAGYTLDLNFALVILPTLKSLQTSLRSAGATREWIPIDDPISFHILIAGLICLGSLVHIFAHIMHMQAIAGAPVLQEDPLSLWAITAEERLSGTPGWAQFLDMQGRCVPITGSMVAALMLVMFITAIPCCRRGTNRLTKRLGGYNLFHRAHLLWKWVYLLLLLHAPGRLWIWLFFPMLFIVTDKMLLAHRQRPYAILKRVTLLPKDVISLVFEVPKGFAYQAGQYMHVGWHGEWHPFTLTSAPEEPYLSVHIRAPSTLDWCSALRRRLTMEAPAFAADPESDGACDQPKPGSVIEYRKCTAGSIIYCRPVLRSRPAPAGVNSSDVEVQIQKEESVQSLVVREEQLPKDAVVIQLSGPFGAPAQKVWQFETIMVVGSGIGVTPFVSILRSVQLRVQQRQAILQSAAKKAPKRKGKVALKQRRPGSWAGELHDPPDTEPEADGQRQAISTCTYDLAQLLPDIVSVPKRIYFYWIVRSQDELDWFYDLLASAVEGPAREIVDINVFLTGEIERSQIKNLTCVNQQFFGRPNWGRIFKQARVQHRGEHIGVFLCGSPTIGAELNHQCGKHTDLPNCIGGTRFSFFKEHF